MENSGINPMVNLQQNLEEEEYEAVFNDEVPQHLGEPKLRLVGKLFTEREVRWKAMLGMINGAWSQFCEPEIQEVGKTRNTFIFIFNRKEEMDRAWEGRPWQISGNMLQLKQWDQNTRPQNMDFSLADFWILVHGIPDHKRTIPNIEAAVAMFKTVHNIDMRGLNPDRYMEFVRVFIETNLKRPLPPGSYCSSGGVRDWLGFRYEKLYVLCYYCGRHGHCKQDCPRRRADLEARIAGPPEGRFTPWMKAGTKASRPPPPPRGRVIHQSSGDAGSSTRSPGFIQNQLWIPGQTSPGTIPPYSPTGRFTGGYFFFGCEKSHKGDGGGSCMGPPFSTSDASIFWGFIGPWETSPRSSPLYSSPPELY
ncbi:unnamed protein product [Linum trigynum]|uniref:CCHC-type domain-containing protein n=1 Tax=Linum trigynum TaxID=586398 RepID=A0AAV2CZ34_9ROSI